MTDPAPGEPAKRPRAKRSSPAQRRAQIIDAAVEVFGKAGYRQGSLKDVAAEVGLTIQGLLHYFPTKEELLMVVLEHRNQARNARLQSLATEEGVLAAGRFILIENRDHPGFMRLFVTLSAEATDPDHPAHDHFVERYRSLVQSLAGWVRDDIAAGRLRAELEPEHVAEQIIALSDGLQLQFLHRGDFDVAAAFDRATAHLAL